MSRRSPASAGHASGGRPEILNAVDRSGPSETLSRREMMRSAIGFLLVHRHVEPLDLNGKVENLAVGVLLLILLVGLIEGDRPPCEHAHGDLHVPRLCPLARKGDAVDHAELGYGGMLQPRGAH